MTHSMKRAAAAAVAVCFTHLTLATAAQGAMIATPDAAPGEQHACGLPAMAGSPEVRSYLLQAGVDPAEVEARLAASTAVDDPSCPDPRTLPAGRGIIGIAVFVFAVLIMTDTLGLTRIFPFTRSSR